MTVTMEGAALSGVDPSVALELLPASTPRHEWLAARRNGIGGSDASAVLGLSKYRSALEVWDDKVNGAPEEFNDLMDWGRRLEPVVREWACEQLGFSMTVPGLLRSQQWPWMQATLDGIGYDAVTRAFAGYEGKCADRFAGFEWDDGQTPDHAELQAQHNMAVTGLDVFWVACLIGGNRPVLRQVKRDDALILDLVEIERGFWELVQDGTEPPVDHSDSCRDFLSTRYGYARPESVVEVAAAAREEITNGYEIGKEQERGGVKAADLARNRARQLLGDSEQLATDGDVFATWRQTGNFNPDRFREENPALADAFTRDVPVLDTEALAKAHPETYRRYRGRRLLINP